MPDMLSAALDYIDRGLSPVPIPHRQKGPLIDAWQDLKITPSTAPDYFNGARQNLGVILGKASGGLTDLDLDCPEAIAAAGYILPKTAVFGHASKPGSHWIYRTHLWETQDRAAIKLMGSDKTGLLEVRMGAGGLAAQTVFPPSTHSSGEPIGWAGRGPGEIADVDGAELIRCARRLAAAAELARNYPKAGGRHDAAFVLGGFLARCGLTPAQAAVFAEAVGAASLQPGDKRRDMGRTARDGASAEKRAGFPALAETFGEGPAKKVASWLDYQGGDERAPAPPDRDAPPIGEQDEDDIDREERDLERRIVDAPILARDPEPERNWIVEDVIPDETLTLLTGEGGIGKTTLAEQLAVAMRIDGEWLGMKVAQGPVLFVTSEDDRKDVNLNLRAILKAEHKSLAHCPGLHILPLADRDACLAAASTKLGAIAATPLWQALVRVIERRKPRLVILDALADLFGGEENARRHVRGFIVLLKQLAIRQKLAVLLIAHPSLTGINTGSGLSGSTDWHNGPRGRLYFERPKDKDDKAVDADSRILTVKKIQYAQEGTVFRLRRKAGAFVYEGKDGGSTFTRAATAAKAEAAFLALLQAFEDQGRSVSPNPSNNYAPMVFEREADADGVSKAALGRAMSKLLKADRIHIETVGPASRQRKKLTPGPAPTKATNEDVQ